MSETKGIIIQVNEVVVGWVNKLQIVEKLDVSLRLCLDLICSNIVIV